jgi:glycosyltransferase involved in cell wall biosynthesis
MKVAVITTDNRQHYQTYGAPIPTFGAAPEALLQGFALMPELEVHVVSCTMKPMKSPEKLADNIWFHSLYVPKIGWMRTSYQGCIRTVRRRLKAIRPDVVHGQGTERECALSAVFSRFPNVLTIHGNMTELARLFNASFGSYIWLAGQLENIALGKAGGVFCNSEYTGDLVKPRARRTWMVANAIRKEFFDAARVEPGPDKCVLVNVGVICERKRQLELLEMAGRLHEQGLKFEMQFVGLVEPQVPYVAKFLERIKVAEAKGYARHLGMKSAEEVIDCLDLAHGLVHFPTEEAFGLVVAESMARKLKFFGARLGGIKDICSGVPDAELFEAEDWAGLEKGVADWIRDGHPRTSGAAELMRARYHPEVIARRHLEIYREVLSKDS